ncbi:MAG: heat-inducible transcription repressor HrcA [Acidobacteria bacterium]|nr:heat-inducible transcription repressor HrcA [Acidobacteriota bacterium]
MRAYIETGEPVSSRRISRRFTESLSPATIRNVMVDLEEEGFLYQPHTSAGRVPTAAAFQFYVQQLGNEATLSSEDQDWIHGELSKAVTPEEVMERACHVLAEISQGLGIVISPPLAKAVLEHIRFLLLPDGRVMTVLISKGGLTRDKVIRSERGFSQGELDRTAEYLNQHYIGWSLDAIRADLVAHLDRDRERYDRLVSNALVLCDPSVLGEDARRQMYVEGAAQIAAAPEFAEKQQWRELLAAIEERQVLVGLLTGCIETPEPVTIQIGIKEISGAGERLSLIGAPYASPDQAQGSLAVLGPMRMQYERAITAVAFVAKVLNQNVQRS